MDSEYKKLAALAGKYPFSYSKVRTVHALCGSFEETEQRLTEMSIERMSVMTTKERNRMIELLYNEVHQTAICEMTSFFLDEKTSKELDLLLEKHGKEVGKKFDWND